MAKRMFAMSQESGRKAAHWIRQEHADLFQHKVADPPIEVSRSKICVVGGLYVSFICTYNTNHRYFDYLCIFKKY